MLAMAHFFGIFVRGFFALLPIVLTIYVMVWAWNTTEQMAERFLSPFLPDYLQGPGIGVLSFLVLIFLIGLLLSHWVPQRLFRFFEGLLFRLPLVKVIYRSIKDMLSFFSRGQKEGMSQVVMVEGVKGVHLFGLVTRAEVSSVDGMEPMEGKVAVFVPYSYAIGGFTVLVDREKVTPVEMSVEAAMKLSVTGWVEASTH
jgi:uncharacterized membrane protein